VPLERDDQDERLARIEQMLEQLRGEVRRFSDFHQKTVREARLTRERSETARGAMKKARLETQQDAATRSRAKSKR
jgi:hypothetical protein